MTYVLYDHKFEIEAITPLIDVAMDLVLRRNDYEYEWRVGLSPWYKGFIGYALYVRPKNKPKSKWIFIAKIPNKKEETMNIKFLANAFFQPGRINTWLLCLPMKDYFQMIEDYKGFIFNLGTMIFDTWENKNKSSSDNSNEPKQYEQVAWNIWDKNSYTKINMKYAICDKDFPLNLIAFIRSPDLALSFLFGVSNLKWRIEADKEAANHGCTRLFVKKTHNSNINDWELMAQAKGDPKNLNVIETLMLEYLKQGDQRLKLTLYPIDEYKKVSEKALNAIICNNLNKLNAKENKG